MCCGNCGQQCCGGGMGGHMGGMSHGRGSGVRILLALVALGLVFVMGVKLGEVKGMLGRDGRSTMPARYGIYNEGYMMNGQGMPVGQ